MLGLSCPFAELSSTSWSVFFVSDFLWWSLMIQIRWESHTISKIPECVNWLAPTIANQTRQCFDPYCYSWSYHQSPGCLCPVLQVLTTWQNGLPCAGGISMIYLRVLIAITTTSWHELILLVKKWTDRACDLTEKVENQLAVAQFLREGGRVGNAWRTESNKMNTKQISPTSNKQINIWFIRS